MKITTLLLIVSIMQVSAKTFAQKITYTQKNITVEQLFREITKQTGYNVLYADIEINTDRKLDANFSDTPLDKVLRRVFNGLSISYKTDGKNIIISKETPSFLERRVTTLAEINVSGRVVDAGGRGLPGASVSVKGKGKSVSTDANGNFYLKAVDEDAVLVVSFIGYVTQEIKAAKELGDVMLEVSLSKLDEVQVIAYGTTTRRLSTSNISSIKGDEIAKQPISNLLLGLQGRVSGMTLTQSSGIPGADVKVRIQGENSLANGNEAFYVIDGVPYMPQNLYSGISQQVMTGTGSTLSFLNPTDVESIEILKDADATAIYGSRAANGAILITTKKGRVGTTKGDLNIQSGFGEITKRMKLLNTEQFVQIRREAIKNAGGTVSATDYDVNGTWDEHRFTDWQEILIGNTSRFTNAQGSISGGSEKTQFLAGIGYIRETSVFFGDFSDIKGNVHLNINHKSKNNKFNFTISSNYLQDANKLPTTDLTSAAIITAPNAPALYNADGTVNWQPLTSSPNTITFTTNPAAGLERNYKANTSNLLGNMVVGYEIFPGLNVKSNFGYNKLETEEIYTNPQTSYQPTIKTNRRSAQYGTKKNDSWIIEPQITYSRKTSFGNIDAIIGSSFQSTNNSVTAIDGSNYANDAQLENINAAGTIVTNINTMKSEYRYSALFGRINYQYLEKYVLNLTARRDGSSRFGSENLFHSFYSAGAAWIFGDESLVKDKLKWLSFGKLRVTYGTTGNDQIPNYQFLNLYDKYDVGVVYPYQQIIGILPTGHSNPYLQWEETKKLNLGIDLGFFNDRLLTNINYYQNRSSNQLLSYGLPSFTGFGLVYQNIPALVQNNGWEFIVESTPISKRNFKWSIGANFTVPKTILLNYPNLEESPARDNYIIGKSTKIIKLYEMNGVNKETGFYEFKAFDGTITSTPSPETDRTMVVTLGPTMYGGLNNSFSFKNLELDFLIQYVNQTGVNYKFGSSYPGIFKTNQPIDILDRWQNIGDDKSIQKVNSSATSFASFNLAKQSDAAYSDASFLRLKNVSFSYNLPSKWLEKVRIKTLRLFIQGQNLLTLTKYKWGDPESGLPSGLPPLKVLTTGLHLTL